MKKRILSVLLALALCIGVIPVSAAATTTLQGDGTENNPWQLSSMDVFENQTGSSTHTGPYYLEDEYVGHPVYYLAAGYYKLTGNLAPSLYIGIIGNVTLDLNGYTLTAASNSVAFSVGILGNANLTLRDSVGGGKIESGSQNYAIAVWDGSLTLESGTVNSSSSSTAFSVFAIYMESGCTATLKGGTVSASQRSGAINNDGGTLNADGGTVSGNVTNKGTITRSSGNTNSTATAFYGTTTNTGTINWGIFSQIITSEATGSVTGTHSVKFYTDDSTYTTAFAVGNVKLTPPLLEEENSVFGGWCTDMNCTKLFDFTTPITSNITLYAKWEYPDYSWYTTVSDSDYTISTAAQLLAFANIVNGENLPAEISRNDFSNATVTLGADIDLSGIANWTPIGGGNEFFRGVFNGNDKTVTNLTVSSTGDHAYVGLFGRIVNATIKKLNVSGSVTGTGTYTSVGGIVGELSGGQIENCTFSGTVSGSGNDVGGIVGSSSGIISRCTNTAVVSGSAFGLGGIVGNANTTIQYCYNHGRVSSAGNDRAKVGGIVGQISPNSSLTVRSCYSTGSVSATGTSALVGGAVGYVDAHQANITVNGFYYLAGAASNGIGHKEFGEYSTVTGDAVAKTADEFSSGEVAHLLQNSVSNDDGAIWGQTLSGDNKDTYPVFADESNSNKVCKVTLKVLGADDTVKYVNYGASVTTTPTAPANHTFGGWYNAESGGNKVTSITNDITLYARFNPDTYTITYAPAAGGTSDEVTDTKTYGVPLTLKGAIFTREGYTQTGWETSGGTKYNLGDSYTANVSVTLYPVWTKNSSSGSNTPTKYTVTEPTTANGSVTVSPKSAGRGATVTITVTPDTGYTLKALSALDRSGNEIELTNNGDSTYSFTMPASRVTINAEFTEDDSMLSIFADVTADKYYYKAVMWAAKNGITGGVSENRFAPNLGCTRAQLVTMLWRAAGCPKVNYTISFSDVGDSYYTEAVRWAASLGVVDGYGNGLFGSNDTTTREQFVTILYRFAKSIDMDTAYSSTAATEFKDYKDVSEYAAEAMQWAVAAGIVQGNGTNLMPKANCTRAQIVTMLYRLLGE